MTAVHALRAALVVLPLLAGGCAARRTGSPPCERVIFLYTEHRSASRGRMEERPVYGCASAAADSLAAERTAAR